MDTALDLFANVGYDAVPTSRIAREAGVSEGLIFRHFGNKKKLLEAIMASTERRLQEAFAGVIEEDEPAEVVRKVILLPFTIDENEYDFWRLQFKLKWDKEYYNPRLMEPLIQKLTVAFGGLQYRDPELEARFLEQILDTISTQILREGREAALPFRDLVLAKYGLQ